MSQSVSDVQPLRLVVDHEVSDADTAQDDAKHPVPLHAVPIPTSGDVGEIGTDSATIWQATGILMLVYDMDADNAAELLRWGPTAGDLSVEAVAGRLTTNLAGCARSPQADLRSTCDDVLFHGAGLTFDRGEDVVSGPLPVMDAETVLRDVIVKAAYALLTPEQMAEVIADRMLVEQVKGMLMVVYAVDADRAFDLLKTRSQMARVRLRDLAGQLASEFRILGADGRVPSQEEYDEVLPEIL